MSRSQVGDVKHSDLPGMEALGREGKLSRPLAFVS
jgi:phospholipase A-2-activating protein